jgi:hypothetical protein
MTTVIIVGSSNMATALRRADFLDFLRTDGQLIKPSRSSQAL